GSRCPACATQWRSAARPRKFSSSRSTMRTAAPARSATAARYKRSIGGTSTAVRSNGFSILDTPIPPDMVRSFVRPLNPGGFIRVTVCMREAGSVADAGKMDVLAFARSVEKRLACLVARGTRGVGNFVVQRKQAIVANRFSVPDVLERRREKVAV